MSNRRLPRVFGYRGRYPRTTGTEATSSEKLVGNHNHEEAYALAVNNSGRGLSAENPFTEISQPGADNVPSGTYYFNLSNGATTAYVDADGTYTSDSSNTWVLYQSFASDNALTTSNAKGLYGNRILINQGGWHDTGWTNWHDGNTNSSYGYHRGTGFVAFFGSSANVANWYNTIPFTNEVTQTRIRCGSAAGTDIQYYSKNGSGGWTTHHNGISNTDQWRNSGSPNNHLEGGYHIWLREGSGSIWRIQSMWFR